MKPTWVGLLAVSASLTYGSEATHRLHKLLWKLKEPAQRRYLFICQTADPLSKFVLVRRSFRTHRFQIWTRLGVLLLQESDLEALE